jgi:hypothetical protein
MQPGHGVPAVPDEPTLDALDAILGRLGIALSLAASSLIRARPGDLNSATEGFHGPD